MNKESLNKKEKARLIIDFWHRTMMHHAIWFAEVQHQLGKEKAYKVLENAYKRSYEIQMTKLGKTLGFEMDEDIPKPLLDLPDDTIDSLCQRTATNWLANDGVWFQAVEFEHGMNDAKRCNDSSWAHFSPFEAMSIKRILKLDEKPGLEGLKKALEFRLYAYVNEQEIVEETENSFIFRMVNCRVQAARQRKGLDDYPCKSGGLVEHTTFAETIDPRIKTECIACPPDKHPKEWFCAWKFILEK